MTTPKEALELKPIGPPSDWVLMRLRRDFKYDPLTGILIRTASTIKTAKTGVDVSIKTTGGYRALSIHDPAVKMSRQITIHRIGWYLHYGTWPCQHIDHINGDPTDNRIANLRYCTTSQNQGNAKTRTDNTSGYKGVSQTKTGHFSARIKVGPKRHHLGTFMTAIEAHEAYAAAAKSMRGDFARFE